MPILCTFSDSEGFVIIEARSGGRLIDEMRDWTHPWIAISHIFLIARDN